MRLVIQQVKSAKLDIEEDNIHREIWKWIIIYLWIHVDDIDTYQDKIARIMKKMPLLKCLTWPDWNINTSLQDIDWEVLLVSNFTLYGRSTKWTKLDFNKRLKLREFKNKNNKKKKQQRNSCGMGDNKCKTDNWQSAHVKTY